MKQTIRDISDGSDVLKMLCRGDPRSIPLFPYRMQLFALWEQENNCRVLQASAHTDFKECLLGTRAGLKPLHQLDTVPCNAFDYYSNIARNEFAGRIHPVCTGVVLESAEVCLESGK